jgi:hypothetical protein
MSTASPPPALAALDRIAARAADVAGAVSIEPRLPTLFERHGDAMRPRESDARDPARDIAPTRKRDEAPAPLFSTVPLAEREPTGQGRRTREPAAPAPHPFASVPAPPVRAAGDMRSPPQGTIRARDRAAFAEERGEPVRPAPRSARLDSSRLDDAETAFRRHASRGRADAPRSSPPPPAATLAVPPLSARPSFREQVKPVLQPRREPRRQDADAPREAAASPVVEVTIGRVEIRASQPAVTVQRVAPSPAAGPSRLALYLRRRNAGMRS